jgi:hypothetical protein
MSSETKCCASCHFGVDGDGETIYCNWTGNKRMPKDACCESYDGEHPDTDYFRKQAKASAERIAALEAERNAALARVAALEAVIAAVEAWDAAGRAACADAGGLDSCDDCHEGCMKAGLSAVLKLVPR